MDLDSLKKQVEGMLNLIFSLELPDRTEALKFLKDCALKFGLVISEQTIFNNIHAEISLLPNFNDISVDCKSETDLQEDKPIAVEHLSPSPEYDKNNSDCEISSENLPKDNGGQLEETKQILPIKNFKSDTEDHYITTEIKFEARDAVRKKKNERTIKRQISSKKTDRLILGEDEKAVDSPIPCIGRNDEFPDNIHKQEISQIEKVSPEKADFVDGEKDADDLKCPGCPLKFDDRSLLFQHFASHGKSPVSCKLCRSNFTSMLNFWRHRKKKECHVSLLKCTECGEKFKYRRHYLKHVLGHNDNNCRYCDEKFSTWVLYKHHLKEKHPDIKTERDLIPCKFCAMSFRRHLGLYNHYQVEHSKGKFVCLSCGMLLPTKEKFKEHALVHESEKTWKCKICKMKFYRRQQLLYHVSVHNSGTYRCLTCDITVTSKVELHKHKKKGHEVKGLEPKFECEVCHKNFRKRVVLKNHMATHSKERKYYCKHCVKSFRTSDALQKHQKRKSHFEKAKIVLPESKYEKIYEDKLICENCGKQYKTQRELMWHLRVHKTLYRCEECGKNFTLKVNLTKHMRLHRNKVCVMCELCGNTFNQLSALNEHMLMKHSDVRNAECQVCRKRFKRKSELNRHMRIHEQKRPFACFCGTAFKQSGHLRTHYKTFHEKKVQDKEEGEHEVRPTQQKQQQQQQQSQQQSQPQQQRHENNLESFAAPAGGVYTSEPMVDLRKEIYVNGEQGTLLELGNLEADYRNANSYEAIQVGGGMEENNYDLRYPQGEMEPINVTYEELNFESSQADKRSELVFASPAIDLSMVSIPEVVANDISLGGDRDIGESVDNFNKLPDDASNIHLVNLSEHIVQEYLLNLP